MQRNLKTVTAFADNGPFTENQVRWWIFQSTNNGLGASGAIVRIGRRVYLDVDRFDAWVESQNRQSAQAAAA